MADPRFTALAIDPRYRLPSRKQNRTAVDPRFKRLFTDEDFRKKASVDKYGRRIEAESGRRELERAYRLDAGEELREKGGRGAREVVGSSEDDEEGEDEALVEKRDLAREGGFSESSSEEESSASEDDDEVELAEETAGQERMEEVAMGEVSRRIAAVNLDWDNLRATDIMAVAASFVPANGRIESVTIYPSEFGLERLEREELEGPPREIFASSSKRNGPREAESEEDPDDDEQISRRLQRAQVNEGDEFDTAKLRQYQLERLRYYYAVVSCDTPSTAKALYDNMDGREYLSTANFFDLRFVPDSTSFEDDRPRDECVGLPAEGYRPSEFRTEALTHSKVRLTWDEDDVVRKEVQKRAFSRQEMDENDLQAYLGSESSDGDSVASRKEAVAERKAKKREEGRRGMRAKLGLAEVSTRPKGSEKGGEEVGVGDMRITFTSGLGGGDGDGDGDGGKARGGGVFENEPLDEESTRARYIRKERERKAMRKERMKMKAGKAEDGEEDRDGDAKAGAVEEEAEDAGFDDPFFTDPSAAADAEKKAKKAERQKKREAREAQDEEAATHRAELELLMADDQAATSLRHFDMRQIEKAEKEGKRKGKNKSKKHKKKKDDGDVDEKGGEGFQLETQDPRFKALFESHEFAIDPTNPRFKGTQGMRALLEEGRRKRKVGVGDEDGNEYEGGDVVANGRKRSTKAAVNGEGKESDELRGLVARLKGGKKSRRDS